MIRHFLSGIFVAFLFTASICPAWGQSRLSPALTSITAPGSEPDWLLFDQNLNLDGKTIFSTHKTAFGLGEQDEMILTRVQSDELGYIHYRYQQHHQGVPVEGAEFIIHSLDGKAIKGNGHLQTGLGLQAIPAVSPGQALSISLSAVSAQTYMWEIPANEVAVKHAEGDPSATFYPEAELLIADADFQPQNEVDYHLCYKFDIHAAAPLSRTWVYVDAQNGQIVKTLDMLMHTDTVGTGETRYRGARTITSDFFVDSLGNKVFRLRESERGGGIETYDMNNTTDYGLAVDFIDDDNYWEDSLGNDATIDAHWGMENTYDYYLSKHGRDSYDDEGSPIISYIHYGTNYFNAFWNGRWSTFGDGNGNPLTSLDVAAHEFTHGVTGNSARLVYAFESGALNESFSDIFGNAIEYYADSSGFDWKIGEDFGAFRNMADPLEFGDPDTYLGMDWFTGAFDNGGVHINSGVQNYWFYLLVEGGSGTNALGENYQVSSIGWDAAASIAYRNLNVYLNSASGYKDARAGALQAAEDLFGVCSDVYIQTAAAWHAVGVGIPITSEDFGIVDISPLGDCGLSNEEEITIRIRYMGCDTINIPFIQVAYFIQDPATTAVELINFTDPIVGGQIIDYTFNTKADLSAFGNYEIVARTLTATDPYQLNDSSEFILGRNPVSMGNDTITFESFALNTEVLDSLYIEDRRRSDARILATVGQDSSYAIRMQGSTIFQAAPPDSAQTFFDSNPDFSSFVFFCVDAEELNELYLDFDLRQTYTTGLDSQLNLFDIDSIGPNSSSFRVLAGGQELSQYNPLTTDQDPFVTHTLNLNAYVGSKFQLVMEGKTFNSIANDPDSIGDLIFIDNIRFRGTTWPTKLDELTEVSGLTVFPNPTTGAIAVAFEAESADAYAVTVLDLMGRIVRSQQVPAQAGQNRVDLDLSDQAAGVYSVRLSNSRGALTKRIVLK